MIFTNVYLMRQIKYGQRFIETDISIVEQIV